MFALRRPLALRASAGLGLTALLATAGACDKSSPGPEEPAAASPGQGSAPEGAEAAEAASDPAPAPAQPTEGAEPDEVPGPTEESSGEESSEATPAEPAKPPADKPTVASKGTAKATGLPSPIFGKGDPSCGRDPGVGQPIKSFSLKTTAGKTISSANLKGRVVLLNFWGTWCKPCLKELPEFDRLYRRYRKSGLVLLAIATDSDPEPVTALAKERRLAAKIAVGGEELANSYKSPSFPFSFVVDEQGIIQASYRGYKPECLGQLEQDIRAQLGAQ